MKAFEKILSRFLIGVFLWMNVLPAEEAGLRLQYIPGVTVHVKCQLEMQMSEGLPGCKIDASGTQTILADVCMMGEASDIPLSQAPFDLQYILKNIRVDLTNNNVKTGFNTAETSTSLPLAQAHCLIDRPIKVHFDGSGKISPCPEELQRLYADGPVLGQLPFDEFLMEWFHPLLALAGESLTPGAKYTVPLHPAALAPLLTYEIISIDEDVIEAKFAGPIEVNNILLAHRAHAEIPPPPEARLSLNGTLEGRGVWSRQNGLLCNVEAFYVYGGLLSSGDSSWNLSFSLKNRFESNPRVHSSSLTLE